MKNNLKKYRTSKGLTQTALASRIGANRSQISSIENHSAEISASIIQKIKKFDPSADIDFILGYKDIPGSIISEFDKKTMEWYKDALQRAEQRIKDLEVTNEHLRKIITNSKENDN